MGTTAIYRMIVLAKRMREFVEFVVERKRDIAFRNTKSQATYARLNSYLI